MIAMLSFGLVVGYTLSEAWSVAFMFWLQELRNYSHIFVAQVNSFHNTGIKVVLALVFQRQMIVLDILLEADNFRE
jgi:hypothetical protein